MENSFMEDINDISPRLRPRRKSFTTPPPDVFNDFRSPAGLELTLSARKRKRNKEQDADTLSVQSFDISYKDSAGKRLRKSLSRVASLANIFSPVRPVGKKIGQSLQPCDDKKLAADLSLPHYLLGILSGRILFCLIVEESALLLIFKRSLSFKNILSPAKNLSQNAVSYKKPQPTPSKRRPSKLWQETVEGNVSNVFSEMQIKRQNAIFELYEGENDLVHDLQMIKETYYNSLKTLGLMTESELHQIFSVIETLVPIHQDLVMSLISQRQPDGSTEGVGEVLLDWLPNLHSYIPYCANQIYAKALLDEKKNDKRIHDFLQRCQESSFSRKLDLWTFLDLPRNRLVKYPLLLKNIQKRTPESHADIQRLQQAIDSVEAIIREVDEKAGEAKCNFHRDRLDFLEESQRHPLIDEAKVLLCDGVLRNSRGTKLTVFVFKKVMVLTRPTTRHDRQCYQVYRYPLPLSELIVEDLKDGEVKMGSFRNMLGQGQGSKYVFRVSSTIQSGKGYTHTLQARDEHDKKQWLNCLQLAIKEAMPVAAKMATPKTDVNDVVEDDTEEQKMDMSFVNDAIDLDESCLPMEDSCLPMENDQGGDCRLKRSDSRSSQKSLHSEVMEAVNVVSERRRSLRSSTKSLASALKRSLSNRSVRSSVSSLPHGEQAEGESVFEKSSDSSSSSEMDPLDFSKSKKV